MRGSGWQRPGCMASTFRMCGLVVEGEVQKGLHLSALWGGADRSDPREACAEKRARAVRPLSLPVGASSRPPATTPRAWFPPRPLPGSVRRCSLALRESCSSSPPVVGTNRVRCHAPTGSRSHARFHRSPCPPRPPPALEGAPTLVSFLWMGLYLQAGEPRGRTERANVGRAWPGCNYSRDKTNRVTR